MSIVLDNGKVRVEFDEEHGRIIGASHARLGIEVVREPRLAENFRLLVPLPARRGHYVAGRDQRLSDVRADGVSCRLTWDGLRSADGEFDICVTQVVRLDGDDITFQAELDNRSPLPVEEVSSVVLAGLGDSEGLSDSAGQGDSGGLGDGAGRGDWRLHYPDHGGRGQEWACYDTFPGSYLGPARPVWCKLYPGAGGLSMPWIDVYHAAQDKGFYFGNHDPEVRHSIVWAELTPSTTHGGPRGNGQYWPDRRHLGEEPAGLALAWNSIPFIPAGGTWQGPPITLHFHEGTWWAAAEYFRSWFDAQVAATPAATQAATPAGNHAATQAANQGGSVAGTGAGRRESWMSREDAWQSTIIGYPDGTVGYRFRDLPELARQARDAGISVLQIDGWDTGGIDRDYPDYSPDPRLGSAEELRQTLAECRDLGVRVMLFTNLQWVSAGTAWYGDELRRYTVRDPSGLERSGMGWEYNTTLGLLGQTVNRMYMANPSRPEFQRIILDQLENVVRLGAPGTQIDKLLGMNEIDYAPDNPAPRDSAIPAGTLETLRRYHERARAANPDFGIASEAHWDRAVPYIEASYSRFFDMDHLPTFAAAFPEYRQSCCVTGDFDYGLVNNCLRFGHIINVEARCLHGGVADVPHLGRYVREALRVRRSLRTRIWDSRLVDPRQASVHGAPCVLYCLHRGLGSGLGTLVLNHFDPEPRTVTIGPLDGLAAATVHRPFTAPERVALPAEIEVPPDEFAIVAFGE